MKKIILAVLLFFLSIQPVFADLTIPTTTKVYFEKDGKQYNKKIEYTVKCYGFSFVPWKEEFFQPGEYTPTKIYSYSATCPNYGCEINENYYLNYVKIDYCDLEGKSDDGAFKIKNFASEPITDCSKNDEERSCQIRFDIPTDKTSLIFLDMHPNHENYDAVEYVKSKKIISGYPDNTFRPYLGVNRAEFTKMLVESVFDKNVIDNCIQQNVQSDWGYAYFKDVDRNAWYAKYVCVAKNKNIISGYPDGTFKPEKPINLAEASKILVGAFGYPYDSSHQYDLWYSPFIGVLSDKKAVPESVETESQNLRRGEFAEIIYRLKENITNKPHYNCCPTGILE
ncbi:S-layer homology domain-containing protein [Candidatus Peregrinibacteria bacterium]|nr:S-layer homology domain-containing protein [Candidatus Peregrinibacteria bacterium]